jgi:hypothetical protein
MAYSRQEILRQHDHYSAYASKWEYYIRSYLRWGRIQRRKILTRIQS